MKNFLVLLVFVVCLGDRSIAQEQDAKTLHETARNFMKQGDYSNAVLVLNRALQQEPESLEILKDLAFTRYLQKDYPKASELIEPLLGRKDADV
ncbi:MAG TPA: tetratricopeptide repeat protein, partial [Chitinophagaceae bacterium]|nr:tetratricopeptide repeat protein [Chitinophagaceae bacterium]